VKRLTEKQSKIYEFIASWQETRGYPPTQGEIRDHFGFGSTNAVRTHLKLIEKKGYIRLNSGKARGIQLIQSMFPAMQQQGGAIPLLGRIAAGTPLWAEQNFEAYLPISPVLFGGGELFALHVTGDSMTGAGIKSGDIAVIRKQESVGNGEIAAVLIDREATLKRIFLSSDLLVLKSENPDFEDLNYPRDESNLIHILGRYRGIVRTLNGWVGS
jgi:repressor LexA